MNKILYKTDQNHPQIKEYKEAVKKGEQNYHVLPRGGIVALNCGLGEGLDRPKGV